jgi:hypothetical protein
MPIPLEYKMASRGSLPQVPGTSPGIAPLLGFAELAVHNILIG